MAARKPFQTDALNASSIPTASLGRLRRHGANLIQTDESDLKGELGERHQRQLDKVHEEWNARIDRELKGVVGCLKDLVELSDIRSNPAPHNHTTQALHLKLRTSQLIRSTQTIRDMAHELKMTLLLSDQVSYVIKRDGEMRLVRRDIETRRGQVGEELVALLGGDGGGGGESSTSVQQGQRKDEAQAIAPDSVAVPKEPAQPSLPERTAQTAAQDRSPQPSAIVVDSSSPKNGGDGVEDEDDEDEEMEEV